LLHAKEELKLLIELSLNTYKLQKNPRIQSLIPPQLLFNFSLSSRNSSMDCVKTNVLIVKERIKLSRKKAQVKYSSLPDSRKEKKILKTQKQERNPEIQFPEDNQQCIIQIQMKPIKITGKNTWLQEKFIMRLNSFGEIKILYWVLFLVMNSSAIIIKCSL